MVHFHRTVDSDGEKLKAISRQGAKVAKESNKIDQFHLFLGDLCVLCERYKPKIIRPGRL